jgi:hypothetical protein
MEYGNIRAIKDDVVLSPALPRLGIRISPKYIYLGDVQYIARGIHHVEEFIFLNPSSSGHVAQLLLIHFEGFLENKQGIYNYHPRQSISLDGDQYLYDLSFVNIQEYVASHLNSDIAHAADYTRQRSYTLAGDMSYQRFMRLASADGRNQFILAYLEDNDARQLNHEGLQQVPEDAQALLDRALKSFEIIH